MISNVYFVTCVESKMFRFHISSFHAVKAETKLKNVPCSILGDPVLQWAMAYCLIWLAMVEPLLHYKTIGLDKQTKIANL